MQVVPLEPSRRLSGDSGAILIEAAIITPLFFYLLFGMIELGLVFRGTLTIGAASQDGARTASVLGNAADSDFQVIQAVKRSTAALPKSSIKNLVVFKAASGANSTVPTVCSTSTVRYQNVGAFCNTYTPADDWTQTDSTLYGCVSPKNYSQGYCPTSRKVALVGANSPPDYIGIYIEVKHKYLTGLFGNTRTLSSTTITRLEPETLQ